MPHSSAAGYPFGSLLASEIAQQPDLWISTLERIQAALSSLNLAQGPVILTGAGTSAYASMAVAAAWPGARAIPTTDLLLQSRAEIDALVPGIAEGGLLISLARSGDSPESVAVVERFQRLFPAVRHLAIVCNANGRLARTPGIEIICLDPRTNDRSLAMTGSFSSLTLAGLCLLHHDSIARSLPVICRNLESRLAAMYAIAGQFAAYSTDRLVVLTSAMHALGCETSLKVVELTGGSVLGIAETFLGFRHGPMSVLRPDTPVLCFTSSDAGKRRYEEDLIRDFKGRQLGRVAVIGEEAASHWPCDLFVPATAPMLPDALRTPFEVPFAQLVAYRCAVHTGVNPDNPSPDGTVTRVVKPFVVHKDG